MSIGSYQNFNAHKFDSVPTQGSDNLMTSDAIYNAIRKIEEENVDSALSSVSENPVQNKVIKAALDNKANSADVYSKSEVDTAIRNIEIETDSALSSVSENPVQNKVIKAALDNLTADMILDDVPTADSRAALSSGGAYYWFLGKQDKIWSTKVTFTSAWLGEGPYYQPVYIKDTTANSMIEIQPSINEINIFKRDKVEMMWIENDDGVLTAYCIGRPPTTAMQMQCVITEVGNTPNSFGAVNTTQVTSQSTDSEYPSAKAVWDLFKSIVDYDEVEF